MPVLTREPSHFLEVVLKVLNFRNRLVAQLRRHFALALFHDLAHESQHGFLRLKVQLVLRKHILDEIEVLVELPAGVFLGFMRHDLLVGATDDAVVELAAVLVIVRRAVGLVGHLVFAFTAEGTSCGLHLSETLFEPVTRTGRAFRCFFGRPNRELSLERHLLRGSPEARVS